MDLQKRRECMQFTAFIFKIIYCTLSEPGVVQTTLQIKAVPNFIIIFLFSESKQQITLPPTEK